MVEEGSQRFSVGSRANTVRRQGHLRELGLGTHESSGLGGRPLRREKTQGEAVVLWG